MFDLNKAKSTHECTTHQQVNRKGAGKATSASSEHNCEDVDTSAAKIEVVNVAKLGRQEAKRSRWRNIMVTEWTSRCRSLNEFSNKDISRGGCEQILAKI